jgi:hypothetical protein
MPDKPGVIVFWCGAGDALSAGVPLAPSLISQISGRIVVAPVRPATVRKDEVTV